MGAAEILISGGVAALLAAVVGGGLKAFGVELPLLASVQRQGLLLVVGVALIGLGLYSARPQFGSGDRPANSGDAAAAADGQARNASAPARVAAELPETPNIVGLPFGAARQFLTNNGWVPIYPAASPMANSDLGFRTQDIFDTGFFEAVSCSGTGMAPCLFRYRNSRGYVLEVVTIGEGDLRQSPVNSARVVDCQAEPKPEGC